MSEFDNDYPANSHKAKEQAISPEPKVIDPVVVDGVKRKRESLGSKFRSTFLAGDPAAVRNYLIFQVALPGARDLLSDILIGGIEKYVYGEAYEGSGRRRGFRSTTPTSPGYVSYNRYSQATRKVSPEAPRAGALSVQDRANHRFDQIVLESRVKAEEVLDKLFDLISRYQIVSVAEFYKLVGETSNFTDEKWGWADISAANIQRTRDGYLVNLPQPVPLNEV